MPMPMLLPPLPCACARDAAGLLYSPPVAASRLIAPHRVATLLRLHAEAVAVGVLPEVDATGSVDPELGLEEARVAFPEVVPAVEAAVASVIDAIVAEHLRAVVA